MKYNKNNSRNGIHLILVVKHPEPWKKNANPNLDSGKNFIHGSIFLSSWMIPNPVFLEVEEESLKF